MVLGEKKKKQRKTTQTRRPRYARSSWSFGARPLKVRDRSNARHPRWPKFPRVSRGAERSINSYAPNQQFRRRRGSSVPSSRVVILRASLYIRPPQDRPGKARRRIVRCRWIIVVTIILSTFHASSPVPPRNRPKPSESVPAGNPLTTPPGRRERGGRDVSRRLSHVPLSRRCLREKRGEKKK